MYWFRAVPLALVCGTAFAGNGYVIGGGVEGDSADGLAVAAIGDFALADKTWLSAAVARNTVDLPDSTGIDSWFGDLGLDHWFDPVGVRAGVSYWGDNDTLDSDDLRASLYWRAKRFSIAADYAYRDFTFDLPATDFFAGRTVSFEADGIGITTRLDVTDRFSIGADAMDYDYSANLRLDSNRGLLELLTFSRLSLINSLVDYHAYANFALDVGKRRWELDVGTWKSAVDGGTTRSATISLLNPLGDKGDIEFSLGVDDSDLYGDVTFLSVFLYFYGGR